MGDPQGVEHDHIPEKSTEPTPSHSLPSLREGSSPSDPHVRPGTLLDLFTACVEHDPDKTAVIDPAARGESLSYLELDQRSDQLATYLRAHGVGRESRVGLFMERSVDFLTALLGTWKVGAVYVPLDPDYPADRLQAMTEDADIELLVTHRDLRPPWRGSSRILDLDLEGQIFNRQVAKPDFQCSSATAAYIIYTSGSTGRPKGVVIEHRALGSYLKALGSFYAMTPEDKILQFSSLSFDLSMAEICLALAHGATLVFRTGGMSESVSTFLRRCREWEITAILPSTAFWHELATSNLGLLPPSLRLVSFGGEIVLPERVRRWIETVGRCVRLINAYGPTEATIESIMHEYADSRASAVIGRPAVRVEAFVLGKNGRPVAPGEAGELCLAGPVLARGYLARPAETAAAFVPHPFAPHAGERLYRTGDLARFGHDGNLTVLGRIDEQVKIRGYRIEPGEIEALLDSHPVVEGAAVAPREDVPGHRYLAAYIVPEKSVASAAGRTEQISEELKGFLEERLPKHMVPTAWSFAASLPMTPNGKIDRGVLKSHTLLQLDLRQRSYAAPRTRVERILSTIWEKVLHLDQVGVHDNIFELGGDSILNLRIVARANEDGLSLSPKDLFQHQTIAELATVASLVAAGRRKETVDDQDPVIGPVPLTPIQHWFFFELQVPMPWHWNQSMMLEVRRPLVPQILERALVKMIEQHDALRMRFKRRDGTWRQYNSALDPSAVSLLTVDLSRCRRAPLPILLRAVANRLQASLDLERGPIMRAVYFDRGPLPGRIFLVIHHLVVDAVSWQVLFDDFENVYLQLEEGRPPRLPKKTTSYRRWAELLVEHTHAPVTESELDYWRRVPRTAPRLPLDFPRDAAERNTFASVEQFMLDLEAEQTQLLLRHVPAAYRTQINDLLLSALLLTLERWTGERKLLVELEGHGREDILEGVDLSRTMGWFTAAFPVYLETDSESDVGGVLVSVKEQLRTLPRRGVSYYMLRFVHRDPEVREELAKLRAPQMSFNYLGQMDPMFARSAIFGQAEEPTGVRHGSRGLRSHILEVDGFVSEDRFWIKWRYSRNIHRRSTIEQLAKIYMEELRRLIAHCLEPGAGGFTASDFPLAGLDTEQLRQWVGNDRSVDDIYPLAPVQEGILFHVLYAPDSQVYFEQNAWSIKGVLEASAFRQAWERLLERHAVLRTAFVWEGLARPLQIVRRHTSLPWHEEDWRHLGTAEQQERLEDLLVDDRSHGFVLSIAPLMRCHLIRLGKDDYRFIWSIHHLLLDGWSLSLLLDELYQLYDSIRHGRGDESASPRPFRDYVEWLGQQDHGAAKSFWAKTFSGFRSPTPLLMEKTGYEAGHRGEVRPHEHARLELTLELTSGLRGFARDAHLTLNTVIQGAWAMLLARTSGEDDVVFGTTIAGRPQALQGVDRMVGPMINALPVWVRVDPQKELVPWLLELQAANLDLRAHGFASLVDVQSWAGVSHDQPLFETSLGFQNFPGGESGLRERHGELEIGDLRYFSQTSDPLTLLVYPEDRLSFEVSYDPARFFATAIKRTLDQLRGLLEAMAAEPALRVGRLEWLSPAARHQLQREWSAIAPAFESPAVATFHDLFAARAAEAGDRPALRFTAVSPPLGPPEGTAPGRDETLTYHELDQRCNQLAHHLLSLPELRGRQQPLIGLCLERSPTMVVAMLAVMKAGAAFVSLDPTYPQKRLAFMVADAGATVLLTSRALAGRLAESSARRVYLDVEEGRDMASLAVTSPAVAIDGDHLAYVIYTSGSTGRPKGVMLAHRGLVNLALDNHLGCRADDVVLQFASSSFDAAISEIAMTLIAGATLDFGAVGPPPVGEDLATVLKERGITRALLPPAAVRSLPPGSEDRLEALTTLMVAGEACPPDLPVLWSRPGREFRNAYGPTENTICATLAICDPHDPASLPPIGRPISGVFTYVLDRQLEALPAGVAGELFLGGAGVARGYLGRPALTAKRFLPDPCSAEPGARLYHTGDRVRFRGDGQLEFLGRIDEQIKVRGFRIEPAEIETVLEELESVRQAVVVKGHGGRLGGQLTAFVVPHADAGASVDLLARLRAVANDRLPRFMVPEAMTLTPELPLMPNGKVDRRTLVLEASKVGDEATLGIDTASRLPESAAEIALAEIWREVLELDAVGVDDDFFALGGHSLLATQVTSRVRDLFQVELTLHQLFDHPSIALLARCLEGLLSGVALPEMEAAPAASRELSNAQKRLWFLDQLLPDSPAYNMDDTWLLEGRLDLAALGAALEEMVRRHEVLRTTFPSHEGRPRQEIAAEPELVLDFVDLTELEEDERRRELERLAQEAALRPFDLARGPLMRLKLLRLSESSDGRGRWALLRTTHHIVSDGWSEQIFYRELSALYDAFRNGQPSPLEPLPFQYADFAAWQRRWLDATTGGEASPAASQLSYWKEQLAELPVLALMTDRPRPAVASYRGAVLPMAFDPALTRAAKDLGMAARASLFMTLVTGFMVLLQRYTGQKDLPVGSPIAGRRSSELEPMIGFFVNTLVLRGDLHGDPAGREMLDRVRRTALEAYAHQDLSFERLVEELNPERALDRSPLFQVVFALHGTPVEEISSAGLEMRALHLAQERVTVDFEIHLWEKDDGIGGYMVYSDELFDETRMRRLKGHLEQVLVELTTDPGQRLSELTILTPAQRHQLVLGWNDTAVERTWPELLHEIFDSQVAYDPDAVAVRFSGGGEMVSLAYGELQRRANGLAHELHRRGVGPEVLVGLMVDHSLEMAVGILGVLKAGGAFVPLDPTYPRERLSFMIEDSRLELLLTQEALRDRLEVEVEHVLSIDQPPDSPQGDRAPAVAIDGANAAYVIYTSGSTGRPKGVVITHRNICDMSADLMMDSRRGERILQFSSLSFDASIFEFVNAIYTGSTLELAFAGSSPTGEELVRILAERRITQTVLPPSAVLSMGEDAPGRLPDLRTLMVAGEACPPELPVRWAPGRTFINGYGPTEAAIGASKQYCSGDGSRPSIGWALSNTEMLVLDRELRPVALGTPGELCLGGTGLGRGYLRRGGLSADRFVPHPFSREPGARLYRTGDLVRRLADGRVDFLGRVDHQVKLRGFRIELEEIEADLRRHPAVRDAVVVMQTSGEDPFAGDAFIAAHVVPADDAASLDAARREHFETCRDLYDSIYHGSAEALAGPARSATFDTIGWRSSLTGDEISADEMREWVDATVERIKTLLPEDAAVLEIGCGTGLLLWRLAPQVAEYVGTDLSPAVIGRLEAELARRDLDHTRVVCRGAGDFQDLPENHFDAVVINSVVQYFPDMDYLVEVLRGALRVCAPDGTIFLGDIRSLPLHAAFCVAMELSNATDDMSAAELHQRALERSEREEELLLAPAFFTELRRLFPEIAEVRVEPKMSLTTNELNTFRYDVTLVLSPAPEPVRPAAAVDLRFGADTSLAELRRQLRARPGSSIGLDRVPDARSRHEVRCLELLELSSTSTAADLRAELERLPAGLDPADLFALTRETSRVLAWNPAGIGRDGCFDAVFLAPGEEAAAVSWVSYRSDRSDIATSARANDPLQGRLAERLVPLLRQHLEQRLPSFMLPSAYSILPELPLLPNGKIDRRRRLPDSKRRRDGLRSDFAGARTSAEADLIDIWSEVLGVEGIGIHDDFFELGGHSLLATQVMSRIREAFACEVALRVLFEYPSVARLAPQLESGAATLHVTRAEDGSGEFEDFTL